jgi:hypothetical protein
MNKISSSQFIKEIHITLENKKITIETRIMEVVHVIKVEDNLN